ncbi:MAG: cell division protein SepF [Quinella sp. 2Q5]|nr:cell division protein SepF [Quinella sp. 2Q5]
MKIMDWVRKFTDILMPIENVEEEEEAKETKKAEAKTAEPRREQQTPQEMQPEAQIYQAEKRAATAGGTMTFTRNGGMVTTSDNGVTSMGGVRYEAYSSETSVRPSLAVVKTPQLTVKVYTPKSFDEQAQQIVNDLLKRNAVIVNLEGVEDPDRQRICDFVIGAVYTIDGKAEKVSDKIILYMPNNVDYEQAASTISSMRRYN